MAKARNARLWIIALAMVGACAQGSGDGTDSGLTDAEISIDAALPDAGCVPGEELCNGNDDDCDGQADEGFPGAGEACDSDDTDECLDDITACSEDGSETVCVDVGPALPELCNGQDDDCRADTADGSGDPSLGATCDGSDSDLCHEGTNSCVSGSLSCSDTTGSTVDLCNGVDDDCDLTSLDGSEDPGVGGLCDGPDGDLCQEGMLVCMGASIGCSDQTTTTIDICNGVDDDCDVSSADGSEDPLIGQGCDGSDSDLCVEGAYSCLSGALSCSDTTGSTVDLCNGIDDDCDVTSADGSEDSLVGIACDGPDSDGCEEGMTQCSAASVSCSDTSDDSLEMCSGMDDDCDGQVDEGIIRDTNPACSAAPLLGSVSGDIGPGTLMASSESEAWYRVTITENNFNASSYLSATIDLDVPANMNFDLFVYCESCIGSLAGSSSLPSGQRDSVGIRRNDGPGNETFDILIEVRFVNAAICADWNLSVTSDTAVAVETCPF